MAKRFGLRAPKKISEREAIRMRKDARRDYVRANRMLTGGQAKLDKNKNNRIDAEDFKLLRKEKGKRVGGEIKKDPTKPVNPFEKRAKKISKVKKILRGVGRLGVAGAIAGAAAAGAKKSVDKIKEKKKAKDTVMEGSKVAASKVSPRMGGGMMQRPMGYKAGTMVKARGGGMARSKPTKMY